MNKEGIFKMSHAIDEDNSQHNKDDDLEEDESIRNIPKPEEREHFNQVCPIRSSDLKNISYNKGISQLNIQSTMNDIEADRLVDQILRGKFANLN